MKSTRTITHLITTLALALFALIAAPAAHAGTYDVYSCKDPATGAPLGQAMPSGWKSYSIPLPEVTGRPPRL